MATFWRIFDAMKSKKKKDGRFSFRAPHDFLEKIQKAASAENRSANKWIYLTLEKQLNGK